MDGIITTVITTYRRPRLLEQAIKSALAQTYSRIQVCVYDNASGDETEETVRRIARSDSRLIYVRHNSNIGAVKNMVHGLAQVTTPYFSMLSDDDVLLPQFYETAMRGFELHPEAMISITATLQVNEHGRILGAPMLQWEPGFYPPPAGFLTMLDRRHPEWTSVLFRREVLAEFGGIDEGTGAAADLDFLLRISGSSSIVVSNEIGAVFLAHTQGMSSSGRIEITWPGYPKMIRNQTENPRLEPDVQQYARQVLERRLKRRLLVANGFGSIVRKNWSDARAAGHLLGEKVGLPRAGAVLLAMTWTAEHFSPAHKATVIVYRVKEFLRYFRQRSLQRRYGAIVQRAITP